MKLYHNFKFFFLEKKALFFFKGLFGILVFKVPSFFFLKKSTFNFSFFFAEVSFFSEFLSDFFSLYNSSFSIFFFKLKLRGLGYRMKKLGSFIASVFLGMTNFFYIHISSSLLLKVRSRRIIFVGYNLLELKEAFVGMLFLKKMMPYELRGIYFPSQMLLLKPGKKKF